MKVLPRPGALSASTWPSCAHQFRSQDELYPRPGPGARAGTGDLVEPLEHPVALHGFNTDASVLYLQNRSVVSYRKP